MLVAQSSGVQRCTSPIGRGGSEEGRAPSRAVLAFASFAASLSATASDNNGSPQRAATASRLHYESLIQAPRTFGAQCALPYAHMRRSDGELSDLRTGRSTPCRAFLRSVPKEHLP